MLLVGGNSLTAGFEKALERSMKQKQSSVQFALSKLRIHARCEGPWGTSLPAIPKYVDCAWLEWCSSDRAISAWKGGCILAEMSGWVAELTTADEYNEEGPDRLYRFNITQL